MTLSKMFVYKRIMKNVRLPVDN